MSDLVVKTNKLNSAVQNLSLSEIRLIQVGIVDARDTGKGFSSDTPLRIDAVRYAEVFNTTRQNAYARLKEAEETLFNRRFSFIDGDGRIIKSRWVQQVKYFDEEGAIEVIFTDIVVKEITRLDGKEKEQFFTKYMIENTSNFKSSYSVRLYELLVQWKKAVRTPLFEVSQFRGQLGLKSTEYKTMSNFKARVLEVALKEINEKSDIKVNYEQIKKGQTITGFKFTIKENVKPKKESKKNDHRDKDTPDLFTDLTNKEQQVIKKRSDEYIATKHITENKHKVNVYKKAVSENWGVEEYRKQQVEEKNRLAQERQQREKEQDNKVDLSEKEKNERMKDLLKFTKN